MLAGEKLDGKARRRPKEARRRIQIVFQNPYDSLNPRHRVGDAVSWPLRKLRGLSRSAAGAEVSRLLDLVRLPSGVATRFPAELSGGERQRVAIARALAPGPDLLVCDEITSALDVSVQAAVLELLAGLGSELGLALLFISHDLGVVASVADRVLVLERGLVCEQGSVEDVLTRPEHDVHQAPDRGRAASSGGGHVRALVARARLEDVARKAGVSKSTASRILNGAPGITVRPETRARVVQAASQLDYEPHAAAQGLRRAETGAFGLLIPDLEVPVYAQMVRGAVNRALERGFAVLLAEDRDSSSPDEIYASLVKRGRIDGLIVASIRPRHPFAHVLAEQGIPHVFLNRAVPHSGRNVTMDDARIVGSALEHLVELGHSRIGFLGGPKFNDPSTRRAKGFRAAAGTFSLEKAILIETGDFRERSGVRQARGAPASSTRT